MTHLSLLFFQKQNELFIQLLQGRRYAQETVYTFNVAIKKTWQQYTKTILLNVTLMYTTEIS